MTPSARDGALDLATLRVSDVARIGSGIPFLRAPEDWEIFGSTVHAVLAADPVDAPVEARLELARRLLAHARQEVHVEPASLVAASDALFAHLRARWPTACWSREVPLSALIDTPDGRRRIEGVIDLLGELDNDVIVIDHKTYPAPNDSAIRARAIEFAPQMATYAEGLQRCGRRVRGCFLHFPIAGAWVPLSA